jgi:hypothetical protein
MAAEAAAIGLSKLSSAPELLKNIYRLYPSNALSSGMAIATGVTPYLTAFASVDVTTRIPRPPPRSRPQRREVWASAWRTHHSVTAFLLPHEVLTTALVLGAP